MSVNTNLHLPDASDVVEMQIWNAQLSGYLYKVRQTFDRIPIKAEQNVAVNIFTREFYTGWRIIYSIDGLRLVKYMSDTSK